MLSFPSGEKCTVFHQLHLFKKKWQLRHVAGLPDSIGPTDSTQATSVPLTPSSLHKCLSHLFYPDPPAECTI